MIGLVSAALTGRIAPGLASDLAVSEPEDLVRIATFQFVHTMMGPGLHQAQTLMGSVPRDLVLYFDAMHEANAERGVAGREQLRTLASRFKDADIPVTVLKGGGDLLDPLHGDPALRFVSDLDLLVPQTRDRDAQAILNELGGAWSEYNPYMAQIMHHLPAVGHPDWRFPVELHIRVGRSPIDRLLPADDVFERSVMVPAPFGALRVMSNEDRACHLLSHAWLPAPALNLRAAADWIVLRERVDPTRVRERLGRVGLENSYWAIDALAQLLKNPESATKPAHPGDALAASILAAFAQPAERKVRMTLGWASGYVHRFATSPAYRQYLLGRLASRQAWASTWHQYCERLRKIR